MPTALMFLFSSSICRTSFCTKYLFPFSSAVSHLGLVVIPKLCLPTAVTPTMTLCQRIVSDSFTASSAFHFLPVRIVTLAPLTLASFIMTSRVFVTLNSSVNALSDNCSLVPVLCKPTLLKLLGTPSQRLRHAPIFLSKTSILDTGNSSTNNGHVSLARPHVDTDKLCIFLAGHSCLSSAANLLTACAFWCFHCLLVY